MVAEVVVCVADGNAEDDAPPQFFGISTGGGRVSIKPIDYLEVPVAGVSIAGL
ncbi:MAG: hypothetical protein JWQ19_3176 [Subtercola sp.]|nr:hypothetical protein [Subtercola sp.]